MDLSVANTGLSSFIESNFTIVVGIFVTLGVMGIATLYDKHKSEEKTQNKTGGLKSSINLSQQIRDLSSKYMDKFSEYSKKFGSLIPKNAKKNNLEKNEIKPARSTTRIPKILVTLKSKITAFLFALHSKKNKLSSEEPALQSNKNTETLKPGAEAKISNSDIVRIVDLKKDEQNLNDKVLSQMSTAGSSKNNEAVVLNTAPASDKSEVGTGLGAKKEESIEKNPLSTEKCPLSTEKDLLSTEQDPLSTERDPLSGFVAEKLALPDKTDSLLDSLKKDIVIKKEKKIDFMTEMQGENLDLKLIKSDLEEILQSLKKFKQYSQ